MAQTVCRLCTIKPSVYFSLLEDNVAFMLEALTFTKVTENDHISTIICLKCLLNLKFSYNFLQNIKKSEKKLYENVQVKQEHETTKNDIQDDLVKLCEKKCPICGLRVDSNLMNDHIREHFNNQQNCTVCNKTFKDIHLYKEHLSEHPENTQLECKKCQAKFQYKTFYDLHVKSACPKEPHDIQQRIATLGLRSKQAISLLKDTKKSQKQKIPALQEVKDEDACERVIKLGVTSTKAIRFLLGPEESEDGVVCKVCNKKFTSKSFPSHTHETKPCEICKKQVTKSNYKKHVEDHTLGLQICHLCGVTLQNKSSLRSHIFYSHSGLRYKCEDCGKIFQKKNARNLHRQREHIGRPTHFCDTCGKGFFSGIFLNKHIKMKHMKLRPHVCEYCSKAFSSRYALKTHTRQHTNETPYRCEVCGEGFRQNVSLRAHRKSKHNIIEETSCECKVCGKGFASNAALHSHMRLHLHRILFFQK